MKNTKRTQQYETSILSFAKDIPNVITLTGLSLSVIGIYSAIVGSYYIAILCMMWAVVFDWFDGKVARRQSNRTRTQLEFGKQLDSLTDMVSSGILPGILLVSISEWDLYFLPGTIFIVMATTMRLIFFNIYGLQGEKYYTGMPSDINPLVISSLFAFRPLFDKEYFSYTLYVSILILATFNISNIKFPKLEFLNCIVLYLTLAATMVFIL